MTTNDKGFTLFEIIITMFILAVAVVPMLNAYAPAIFSTSGEEEMAVFTNGARRTLNRVAALDFKTLYTNRANPVNLTSLFGSGAEAAKETLTFQGKSYTPTVGIADVSGGAGGLLEITVTIKQVGLKTLRGEY